MGGAASRNRQPNVPIPRYSPPVSALPPISGYPQGSPMPQASGFPQGTGFPQGSPMPQASGFPQGTGYPPFNISRPGSPVMPNMIDVATLNRRQQRKLEEANRTIQTLQNQMGMMQRNSMGTPPPYAGSPSMYQQQPPMSYNNSSPMGQNSYPPPSPLLQRYVHQSPYQQQAPVGLGGYRDTDFAAVANIAGLNPADIALLHREYMGLTRGGSNKIDRVVFRQLLREAMVEANNENIDRAIENIFVSIDRNHDGFIDFPEFVGAFRDLLRGTPTDPQSYANQHAIPELINDQMRGYSFNQNPMHSSQSSGQFISLPPSNPQQSPLLYNGASPLVISLDPNQSPYMFNQGQPLSTQQAALQCIPLPM